MNKLIYILFMLFQTLMVFSQRGYYIKNDTVVSGIDILNSSAKLNSQICQVKERGGIFSFIPGEIDEYSLNNGTQYISKRILLEGSEKNVFLEKLSVGRINLYYYKDRKNEKFFLENAGSGFTELKKTGDSDSDNSFRNSIKTFMADCDKIQDALEVFRFNKVSLRELARRYSSCEEKPFPVTEAVVSTGLTRNLPGATGGSAVDIIFPNSTLILRNEGFIHEYSLVASVGINKPVQVSSFSIYAEFSYQKDNYLYHFELSKKDEIDPSKEILVIDDVSFGVKSLDIPVMIRYRFFSRNLIPFINAGPVISLNKVNNSILYTTTVIENIVNITKEENLDINYRNQFGFTIGTGIQYKLSLKKSLSFELRYSSLYGTDSDSFDLSRLKLLLGYNFYL